MAQDRALEALAALMRGDSVECQRVLQELSDAQQTALASACHLFMVEIVKAHTSGQRP